ncbi:MAG: hypothetical protein GKR91_19150 [Pseudomonadales bacterium]|nr:hypothetical protein [Pseudomonadales bacterium]
MLGNSLRDSIRVFFVLTAITLLGCSSEEQSSTRVENLETEIVDQETAACLYGAESMIEVARQAVNDTSSRPERRESRRVLMEDWVARLEAGENPCGVYADIQLSATTF